MATSIPTGKIAVALNPVPGFCVKSKATSDAVVHRTASYDQTHNTHGATTSANLIPVQKGSKIFVNIAWDANVPPPPPGSEDAIQNAMQGLEIDESNLEVWFVPVVVSDARQDSDRAGQPAIVFDCVFNSSIKSRTLTEPEFKSFIIELALQRIEAQTTIVNRQARQVLVSAALYPPGHPNHRTPAKLVQEITDRPSTEHVTAAAPKGILKKSLSTYNSQIRIVIDVPALTHAVIPKSTLDVEPKRLSATFGKTNSAEKVLKLKRMRDLDVDGAKAEWRVADRAIVLMA
ncbi:hypothetical protein BU15DRAFT_88426 [Melanogaster broomeanus]|nr:hypothetical protein BU15DRAFT_88426 [Melanogaster broomeanus]